MRYGAKLGVIPKVREMINVFGGVNRLPSCGENEFAEMSNMTCDCYPRAAAREPRLEVELTKTLETHEDTVLTTTETGWQIYTGEGYPGGSEEVTGEDAEKVVGIDNREFIEDEDNNVIENPGYGYKVTTWGQDVTITEIRYRTNGYNIESNTTVKTVRRTISQRVVKATDPECLTFNGDHIFYLDRVKNENGYIRFEPVLDGITVDYGENDFNRITGKFDHKVVTFGAYFIVYPELVYVNSADPADVGRGEYIADDIEAQTLFLSDAIGNPITPDYTDAWDVMQNAAESIDEGKTWLTQVGSDLKLFMMTAGEWKEIDAFVSLTVAKKKGKIATGDNVIMTEARSDIEDAGGKLDGDGTSVRILYVKDEEEGRTYVMGGIIPKQTDNTYSISTTTSITFFLPKVDVLFESNGRLWGCRYGKQWVSGPEYMFDDDGNLIELEPDGEFVNEIYCTGARSFTQWQRFTGEADGGPLDTDSFVFNVSEAGAFTGGCVYNGVPTFFKKDTMYRVSGSLSSGFSLYSDSVPGVQEGSSDGICIVNGVLYYKASTGVYAYTGGMPQRVSDKLGSVIMRGAVAGVYGHKAVFFMKELGEAHLYVYDTETGAWTIEETDPVLGMTEIDDALVVQTTKGFYMMSQRKEQMKEYAGLSVNFVEKAVHWSCCSGLMGLGNTDKKYVTRIELRYLMPVTSMMFVDVEYDSSGKRIRAGQFQGSEKLETRVASIRLRRCDHFRLYMQGVGACEIVTLTRTVEGGSERNG